MKPANPGPQSKAIHACVGGEQYEQQHGKYSPVGLILCADKSEEQIKLLQLDKSGIRAAAYLTELSPRKFLQRKLDEAILLAQHRLGRKSGEQDRIENKS